MSRILEPALSVVSNSALPTSVGGPDTGESPSTVRVTPMVPTARVRVLVVTWNRQVCIESLLLSLSRQTYPRELMDVTVIDNASTDGTPEFLRERFRPEMVVMNQTSAAHEPNFQIPAMAARAVGAVGGREGEARNTLGFGSLTVIRNRTNVGGCGGFNTGFAFTEWAMERERMSGSGGAGIVGRGISIGKVEPQKRAPTELVWLVDDDADVPADALENLARVMMRSTDIGLVGSRTVNIADRRTTIETTIYYNRMTGAMQDDCPPLAPSAPAPTSASPEGPESTKREAWLKWIAQTGGTRGERVFTGQIDVDVVSACSMLARWGAVVGTADKKKPAVGFWDWRYFIYCDDADWCLRFAKAGWRVVLALDAVVYHTPWNLKLTPARIYYANRNKVWMGQKVLAGQQLRTVTTRAMKSILLDSLRAAMHRRLFHADIILDTARDIAIGRTGKTGSDGPSGEPVFDAMKRLNLLRSGVVVAIVCPHADALKWADDLRTHVRSRVEELNRMVGAGGGVMPSDRLKEPEYRLIVRNDVGGELPSGSIVYGSHRGSKIKKQLHIAKSGASAVVVFDQTNDFPALARGGWNLHIDQKKPTVAQVERDGWVARLRFTARWAPIAVRCLWFARRIKPYKSPTRYG